MMRFLILVLIAAFVAAHAPEDKVPGIIDITASNAASVIDGTKNLLVEFYAPWCGHCKNLAPEMAKLGEVLEKSKPTDVAVAKVNCDEHRDVCSKYDVKGYPTIKYFPKGASTPEDYNKGRSAEDFVEFLNDKANANLRISKPPSFVTVLTPQNFDSIISAGKNVLVEFYAPWCGHCKKLEPDYEKVGFAFRLAKNVVVAKVDADKHRELGEKFGVTGFPTIKFFPAGSKTPEDYSRGRSVEDFINFLNEKSGAQRLASGLLNDKAGTVASLGALAGKFIKASAADRAGIIKEAESVAQQEKGESDYYVRTMKKILETKDYASKESERLTRVLNSGAVSEDRLDNMQTRINILNSFQ